MDQFLLRHLDDLSRKAERDHTYCFSDFLSEEELSELLQMKRQFPFFVSFGGAEGTARNMVRFGSPEELGYEEDFPVLCLKILPKNEKYAEALTHRDYLGALMNLGIERKLLGDIIVRGKTGYLFCAERIGEYLTRNVERIRHTDVVISVCDELPAGELYTTERLRITAASMRLDVILAAVAKKSRSEVEELLRQKKVFVNGINAENGAKTLSQGDKVSLRGFGKFKVAEDAGRSKKGKDVLFIDLYK